MKTILLHACCAPCASYPIKKLKEDGYTVKVFFYNPNIYPLKEYEIRRDEIKRYCSALGIDFFEGEYEHNAFKNAVRRLENEPEKGRRCFECFKLRLQKTAQLALELRIEYYTTTLSVSPHKNSLQIFEAGRTVQDTTGVKFLEYNFKKQDGFKISRQIARENNMYAQTYCGCEFSKRD